MAGRFNSLLNAASSVVCEKLNDAKLKRFFYLNDNNDYM